jgi:hypothetical protein
MSKLIIKIVLVILPVIALALALEIVARRIPTSYRTKLAYFNQKKNQIEILVMGSSHANFGINPLYFGRPAYNFSNASQCLYQDYKVLLKYLPECKNVKMVIIPISYFSIQSDLAKSPEAWRCAYYAFYLGVQAGNPISMYDLKDYSALFLWDGPLKVIKGIRNINKMDINEYGYQTPEKSKSNINEIINDNEGKRRAAYHDKFMSSSLIDLNVSALEGMANELTKRNIQIIFVTTPVFKTYQQHISKANYDVMTRTMDMMSKKYSAKSFNYFYDNRFEINDFLDNDHLNAEGARKFSIILKNEIIDKLILQ